MSVRAIKTAAKPRSLCATREGDILALFGKSGLEMARVLRADGLTPQEITPDFLTLCRTREICCA